MDEPRDTFDGEKKRQHRGNDEQREPFPYGGDHATDQEGGDAAAGPEPMPGADERDVSPDTGPSRDPEVTRGQKT